MPDIITIGSSMRSIDKSPKFTAYDMVVINTSDSTFVSCPSVEVNKTTWISSGLGNGTFEFSYDGTNWKYNGSTVSLSNYGIVTVFTTPNVKSGDKITVSQITNTIGEETEVSVTARITRTGRCLEVDNPWGTVEIAKDMLERVHGYEYQPYTAQNALFTPAAELGDTISASDIWSGIYSQDITFNGLMASDISAPSEEEIDYEFPYTPKQDRKYNRKFLDAEAALIIQASKIEAKVSARSPEGQNDFSWELLNDHFSLLSNGNEVFRADEDGINVTGNINATSGNIGGCEIVNGVLTVGAAHIGTIYADAIVKRDGGSWITGSQIAPLTISGGSGGNIALGTVQYGNTAFTSTLDAVGVNSSNIIALGSSINAVYAELHGTINCSAIIATNASFPGAIAIGGYDAYWSGRYLMRNV